MRRQRFVVIEEVLQTLAYPPAGLKEAVKISSPADRASQDFHIGHKGYQRSGCNLLLDNQKTSVPHYQHHPEQLHKLKQWRQRSLELALLHLHLEDTAVCLIETGQFMALVLKRLH